MDNNEAKSKQNLSRRRLMQMLGGGGLGMLAAPARGISSPNALSNLVDIGGALAYVAEDGNAYACSFSADANGNITGTQLWKCSLGFAGESAVWPEKATSAEVGSVAVRRLSGKNIAPDLARELEPQPRSTFKFQKSLRLFRQRSKVLIWSLQTRKRGG